MRAGLLLLLLLVVPVLAQGALDPFRPLDKKRRPLAAPGWESRVDGELARIKRRLARKPDDLDALERALPVMETLNRLSEFQAHLLKLPGDDPHLRAIVGYVAAQTIGNFFEFPAGMDERTRKRFLDQIQKAMSQSFTDAAGHLRAAVKARPADARSRIALAKVLEVLDPKKNADEIKRLRDEAAAIELKRTGIAPQPIDLTVEVAKLRQEAETLEQHPEGPRHDDALALRKRALIYEYCTYTIPFEVDLRLWEACATLAPRHIVLQNLNRTYRDRKGEIKTVEVQYYAPQAGKTLEVLQALGKMPKNGTAAALLLSYLRTARVEHDYHRVALEGLAKSEAARPHLALLLKTALLSNDANTYHPFAKRHFVRLAGLAKLADAAPVLEAVLDRDDDLFVPLGVADALGRIGAGGDALLRVALDKQRAPYFRRRAAFALGKAAPDRLAQLEGDADLAVAVAAARYRNAPNDKDRAILIAALDRDDDVADAARFAADLAIREAVDPIMRWVAANPQHFARADVQRAGTDLVIKLKG